ncbi:MAG: carboxypeptidase regulatory-like domain-containing protein [Balneolaceae bacterium]
MNKKILCLFFFVLIGFTYQSALYAQGVTTASIKGSVVSETDEILPGTNVVAIHIPSGSRYGTSTRSNGRYTLPNLRIGGPYEITATFIGFESVTITDVFLALGESVDLDFVLREDVTEFTEIVVTTGSERINRGRTGAATNIGSRKIQEMPTITRSAADIYRLNPASDGNSFGGRNDQFNNFSLDGSIFNNPFGLDAATAGGQANAQPISLDAIDQIQVSLAPYDVTQAGFTGASINAVTKSGTNTFTGSVFGFFRNQNLTGSKVSGQNIFVPDLTQTQTGISLGGPIIKNKLFFFANFELERRDDLGTNFLASAPGRTGENVSRVRLADLEAVSDVLFNRFGYETGSFEGFSHDTNNSKGIFKLDWNMNNNHSLAATYNFLDAYRQLPANPDAIGRRGPDATTLQFFNSGYRINNVIHSGIVELRSIFGNRYSNKIQLGYTNFSDSRDPFSEPFPVININENGVRYIVAGHEPFSINNRLGQEVWQITNDFNIFANNHTITVGASFEMFKFDNSFNLGVFDSFDNIGGTFGPGFNSTQDFLDFVNSGQFDPIVAFARNAAETNNANNSWALAETNVGQFAFYAQDEWTVSDRLVLTYGLRVDLPLYFNTPTKVRENIERKGGLISEGGTFDPDLIFFNEKGEPVQFDPTRLPDQDPLFSPRVGFNFDALGDQSLQIRGGSGLFSGRFPFVWIGNQVANTDFFFFNVTDPDFKFPQVWRSNIGADKSFGNGWVVSSDVIYTNDINAMLVRNFGLRPPTGTLQGVDNRAVFTDADKALNPFGGPGQNAFVFTNTSRGYSLNFSTEIEKTWNNNFFASIGYNFLQSRDVNSNTREISSDIFEGNPILGNPNTPSVASSIFGNRHRVVGSANKAFIYGENDRWRTAFSLFFEYAQGGRFSYTYSGDANLDGSPLNDLIYIPTTSELQTYTFTGANPEQQRAAFDQFIEQDDYLSSRRGQFAERNSILSPWFNRWDLRIMQDFRFNNSNRIQVSMDILNVGNLISSSWGVRELPLNTQPVGITVDSETLEPVFNFDTSQTSTFVDDFSLRSRWQLQFGLRYMF